MPYPHQDTTRNAEVFRDLLIREVRRRLFDESIPRLRSCLHALSEEEIWSRPNEHSNSVGNLVLHLCGNLRQWVLSGLAKQADRRDRQAEFSRRDPLPASELLRMLDQLAEEVDAALNEVQAEDLLSAHEVQTFRESGLSILIHVVEHFSYHVGQITYATKAARDMDMGYYKGVRLE